MKIVGVITLAMPETNGVSKSGKEWRKRSYVCRYDNSNAQYPKEILFDVIGQKIEKLNLQQGCEYELEVDFNVKEWHDKWFMQACAWRASRISSPGGKATAV